MLIHEITLKNFLSYGPDSKPIPLKPLNIIIGPNGSGKSNLLEAIALLQSAPGAITSPIREGGGIYDWLWKGVAGIPIASLEIVLDLPRRERIDNLRYRLDFTEVGKRFEIVDERLEYAKASESGKQPYFFYRYENNHPVLNIQTDPKKKEKPRILQREDIDPEKSILAQRRDPDVYPEITYLADTLANIRIYRDWAFGRNTPARIPQPTDSPNKWLEPDANNLGLILSRMSRDYATKNIMLEYFRAVYADARDFNVIVEGGRVQVFVQEEKFSVPATRLSDGTLRYLTLLATLLDPSPPPLICIDEPELGLHHDLINNIADLLKEASTRTQLIVTTHSDFLVDAMSDDPESILVCEKHNGSTTVERLEPEKMKKWLEKKYRLGELWISGEIGGKRW